MAWQELAILRIGPVRDRSVSDTSNAEAISPVCATATQEFRSQNSPGSGGSLSRSGIGTRTLVIALDTRAACGAQARMPCRRGAITAG